MDSHTNFIATVWITAVLCGGTYTQKLEFPLMLFPEMGMKIKGHQS